MDYQKELLLFVATTLVASGATLMSNDVVKGTILLLIGAGVFIGRGFYKKYMDGK